MLRTRLLAVLLPLLLAACAGGDRPDPRPARADRPAFTTPAARQCLSDLTRQEVRYSALPNRDFGGGCTAIDSVKLLDIGLPTTQLGAMTCPLARAFAGWARHAVQPAAIRILGSHAVRIETFGTYACRNVNGGATGRRSEHASANAVDVAAIVLADGRRVSLLNGWNGSPEEQRFLRVLRDSACKRFGTVLSPEYNRQHADHFHFDMSGRVVGSGGGYCR